MTKTLSLFHSTLPVASQLETDNEEEETPVLYTMNITVNDGTNAVQGAKVTFTDTTDSTKTYESGNSGSSGGCTVKCPAGTYSVAASCDGYAAYTHESEVTVSENASLTISLTATEQGGGG